LLITVTIRSGAVTENVLLVAEVSPVDAATRVYPFAALSIERSLKLAIPDDALFVVVPLSTAPLGFVPIDILMEALEDVTTLPALSRIATVGGPEIEVPKLTLPGCVVNASETAEPMTAKDALSPAVSVSPLVAVAVITTLVSAGL
jgi:hypothetical protein